MKTLVKTGVLSLALAWPVAAQRMEIGDDGFTTVPEDTSSGPLIDIDDDGWSEVSPEASQDLNSIVGTPGQCTELESSAGLSASECGTLTRGEIIRRIGWINDCASAAGGMFEKVNRTVHFGP